MADEIKWGPNNPHPLSRMKTELVWEGKYDEYGNRRPVSLPDFPLVMQKIETIDEPRDRSRTQGTLFQPETAHRDDFRNRLIWGDNKLALAALLQEFRGQVKLIYIDPPFDVGADFTASPDLGEDMGGVSKSQSLIEAVAYRDTWGKGTDSYIAMMFTRLSLMRDLLANDGTMVVHVDYRVSGLMRVLLDEVFGKNRLINEVAWCYGGGGAPKDFYPRKHDTLFIYSKGDKWVFNKQFRPYSEGTMRTGFKAKGMADYELNPEGAGLTDWWSDCPKILSYNAAENYNYPTQKPESLLRRIITGHSNVNDLVADFFCGSGTAIASAEALGRRWIAADLGRYAVHTTRKRLIGVQRELHEKGEAYRSFDVYNLGRYERQWWQKDRLKGADEGHREAVLKFFRAQALENPPSPFIHASKAGAYVHVDKIDSILTLDELREVTKAVHAAGGRKVICLAWEFEMDLRLRARSLETELGIDIQLKYIPREIMEPNRNEIQFFDAAAIEAEAFKREDGSIDIRLKTFLPSLTEVPEQELEMLRERAVKSPFDFIDFWSIDFEHRDDKPFEHHWQDFRTRKDRSLKTESDAHWKFEGKGTRSICVKVIDVFGIDTTTVVEVRS
jgi:adenine-specific DNA-methyltransferase